jgi:hypothetical protein
MRFPNATKRTVNERRAIALKNLGTKLRANSKLDAEQHAALRATLTKRIAANEGVK